MSEDQSQGLLTTSPRPECHPCLGHCHQRAPSSPSDTDIRHLLPRPSSSPTSVPSMANWAVIIDLGDLAFDSSVPSIYGIRWTVSLARSNSPFTSGMKGCCTQLSNDPACGDPSSGRSQTKAPILMCYMLSRYHLWYGTPAGRGTGRTCWKSGHGQLGPGRVAIVGTGQGFGSGTPFSIPQQLPVGH